MILLLKEGKEKKKNVCEQDPLLTTKLNTVTDGPPQQVLRGKLAGRAGWNNVVMGHTNPTLWPKLQPGHRGCS